MELRRPRVLVNSWEPLSRVHFIAIVEDRRGGAARQGSCGEPNRRRGSRDCPRAPFHRVRVHQPTQDEPALLSTYNKSSGMFPTPTQHGLSAGHTWSGLELKHHGVGAGSRGRPVSESGRGRSLSICLDGISLTRGGGVIRSRTGSAYAALADFDFEAERGDVRCASILPPREARNATGSACARDLAFQGHRPPPDSAGPLAHLGAHGSASRHDKERRARAGAGPREADRGRVRRHTLSAGILGGQLDARARSYVRHCPFDASAAGQHHRAGRPRHDELGDCRRDLRHRWRPAARAPDPALTSSAAAVQRRVCCATQ